MLATDCLLRPKVAYFVQDERCEMGEGLYSPYWMSLAGDWESKRTRGHTHRLGEQ